MEFTWRRTAKRPAKDWTDHILRLRGMKGGVSITGCRTCRLGTPRLVYACADHDEETVTTWRHRAITTTH